MTIVSSNIKYLRRLNGHTQEQFSKIIGIKRSLLGAYEEARANPNLDNLQNMAKIFGTNVDELIKTDIRKIRETSNLNYQNNQPFANQKTLFTDVNESTPTTVKVIDTFFTDIPVGPVRNVNHIGEQLQLIENEPHANERIVNSSVQNVNYTEKIIQSAIKGIPFVNKNELTNYISKRTLNPYLISLPQISLPNININNTRAFAANEEFPNESAIIIGEIVERNSPIHEGQHHILICNDGRLLFRRLYDHTRIKGCYLLSSDDHQISSTEIPESQVVELLKFVAHIGYSVPKITNQNPRINSLIEELHREISKL